MTARNARVIFLRSKNMRKGIRKNLKLKGNFKFPCGLEISPRAPTKKSRAYNSVWKSTSLLSILIKELRCKNFAFMKESLEPWVQSARRAPPSLPPYSPDIAASLYIRIENPTRPAKIFSERGKTEPRQFKSKA